MLNDYWWERERPREIEMFFTGPVEYRANAVPPGQLPAPPELRGAHPRGAIQKPRKYPRTCDLVKRH